MRCRTGNSDGSRDGNSALFMLFTVSCCCVGLDIVELIRLFGLALFALFAAGLLKFIRLNNKKKNKKKRLKFGTFQLKRKKEVKKKINRNLTRKVFAFVAVAVAADTTCLAVDSWSHYCFDCIKMVQVLPNFFVVANLEYNLFCLCAIKNK